MSGKEQRFYSLKELKAMPQEPNNYLIDGFLWENDHVILLGREKTGKSILAMQMACALSCGEAFLGEYEVPKAMQIAYIQTEGKRHETVHRLRNMTDTDGVACNEDNMFICTTHSWNLDSRDGYNRMVQMINKSDINPDVIFLDPLYMSMNGDLSDNMLSRHMAKNIRQLGERFNAAIILVHHEHRPKRTQAGDVIDEGDQALMGSFVWSAFPDHIIHLRMRPDKLRTLSCNTQRSSRVIESMQLELKHPKPLMYIIHGTADHMPYVNQVEAFFRNNKDRELCANDLVTEAGLSISAIRKSLMYLHKKGNIEKVNPGHRPTLYKWLNTTKKEK